MDFLKIFVMVISGVEELSSSVMIKNSSSSESSYVFHLGCQVGIGLINMVVDLFWQSSFSLAYGILWADTWMCELNFAQFSFMAVGIVPALLWTSLVMPMGLVLLSTCPAMTWCQWITLHEKRTFPWNSMTDTHQNLKVPMVYIQVMHHCVQQTSKTSKIALAKL